MYLVSVLIMSKGFYCLYNTSKRAILSKDFFSLYLQNHRLLSTLMGIAFITLSFFVQIKISGLGAGLLAASIHLFCISSLMIILFPFSVKTIN